MLAPVDVKKVDAGGGLIHGNALDFAQDATARLVLSHGAQAVPADMPAGTRIASFGDADILRAGKTPDRMRERAVAFLAGHFPGVAAADLKALADCPTRAYPPGAAVGEAGTAEVLLLVSGTVEERDAVTGTVQRRGSGSLLGDSLGDERAAAPGYANVPRPAGAHAWTALSELTVLAIPAGAYGSFTLRGGPASARRTALARRKLLARCALFAPIRADNVLNLLAAAMKPRTMKKGETVPVTGRPVLMIVADGEVDLTIGEHLVETLGPGGFWGEERLVSGSGALWEAQAASDVTFHMIPGEVLAGIPIVQWGIQEAFERRLHGLRSELRFTWTESFRVGVPLLDEQHRRLFALANDLSDAVKATGSIAGHDDLKQALLRLMRVHFAAEEQMLEQTRYPRRDNQKAAHAELLVLLERVFALGERRSRPRATTVDGYLKDWLIRHTLLEDLLYRPWLAKRQGKPAAKNTGATGKKPAAAKRGKAAGAARGGPAGRSKSKPAAKKQGKR